MKKAWIPIAIVVFLLLCIFLLHNNDFSVRWTPVSKQQTTEAPVIKVYLESSGSMDGYLCDGSEMKDAVYSYVSTLASHSDTLELYYINTEIIPYSNQLQSFIRDLTVSNFKKIGGNHSHSDIGEMLNMILKKHDAKTISIFISDFILDVPQGNAQNYFYNRKIDIRNAFVSKLNENPNLGVEIFRLESRFDGPYFTNKGTIRLSGIKRPYYMWIIGDKHILAELNSKIPFTEIEHGYKNYFAYSTYEDVPFEIANPFGMTSNPCVCKTSINGQYTINIKADFSAMLQPESMICNVGYYKTQNPKTQVVSVNRLQDKTATYSHVLSLNINDNIQSCEEHIRFEIPQEPSWLEDANDETGDSIMQKLDKTTGIKHLLLGVAEAYRDSKELAGIKFVITNN